MFVREKKISRGEKTYSYYQLVEGERVDGKVRQRVLQHLGPQASRKHADYVARSMGLMCSALECGQRGVHEHWDRHVGRARFCEKHKEKLKDGETVRAYSLW